MIKRIFQAVLCSLALGMVLCGCGPEPEEALFIGSPAGQTLTEGGESPGTDSLPDTAAEPETEICVYVCGAVKNPGVVKLKEGSRWADALEAAGGFREDAGRDCVNLAARAADGERLYFPTVEEGIASAEEESGLVNINTADAGTLCTLPGIGEARAADIIRFRETSGPFETCEDIMKVPGIKTSVYGKISDLITVD